MPEVPIPDLTALTPEHIAGYTAFGVVVLVFKYLFKRLGHIEQRLESAEAAIAVEKAARAEMRLLLDRACLAYENARGWLRRTAQAIRLGMVLTEAELGLMENTPTVEEILKSPLDTNITNVK